VDNDHASNKDMGEGINVDAVLSNSSIDDGKYVDNNAEDDTEKTNNNEDPVLVAAVTDNYDTIEFLFENKTNSELDEENNIAMEEVDNDVNIWI